MPATSKLDETVPRSAAATTIRSSRQSRGRGQEVFGLQCRADQLDSRVVVVIHVEVGHGVNAGIEWCHGNAGGSRCLHDECGIGGGNQEIAAAIATLPECGLGDVGGVLRVIAIKQKDGE